MLTFNQIASSLSLAEVETIQNLLLDLPEATYSSINVSPNYIITREAAQRIMLVTQIKDHKAILEELVHWNLMSIEEQKIRNLIGGDDFIEISPALTMLHGHISISIHRMSDADSVYLTLHHDSEHVMMDIQLRDR